MAVRLAVALLSGTNGDLVRMQRVAEWLASTPLDVYVLERPHGLGLEWPYLPGALPLMLVANELAQAIGVRFDVVERLPIIAANLALVWAVDSALRRRARPAADRVLAAAVLSFSPLFVLEAGWHGQIDMVATLLATLSVLAWDRLPPGRRALAAGALIGAAAAVKTPLGVLGLAYLPLVADRREAARLIGAAAAVVLVVSAPYLARDAEALLHAASAYRGLPGVAGLNLLVQPELAQRWLSGRAVPDSEALRVLVDLTPALMLAGLAAAFAVLVRTRPRPEVGIVLVLLAAYVTGVNLATHYLLWIVPFLLIAGWVRTAAALNAALVVPVAMLYVPALDGTAELRWSTTWANVVYVPWMVGLWVAGVAGAAVLAARLLRSP